MESCERDVDDDIQLKLRQFFEKNDARDKVRNFMTEKYVKASREALNKKEEASDDSSSVDMSTFTTKIPFLIVEFGRGSEFIGLEKLKIESFFSLDIDAFDQRYVFENIFATENPVINQKIEIQIPDDPLELIKTRNPLRICLSLTYPTVQYLGMAVVEWRKALKTGVLEEKIKFYGIHDEIVGIIPCRITIDAIFDFSMIQNTLNLQLKQEKIEDIEDERNFSFGIQTWWKELTQQIDDKTMIISAREIGSGKSSIFNFVTPMTIRNLYTPSHCLRYCYLIHNLIAPPGNSFLPNWVIMASRCGRDREKLHLLVSLLRGFGMNAFVVVSRPRPCAVIITPDNMMFFDIATGKYGSTLPQITESVSFVYNDKSLYVNLKQRINAHKLNWDLTNKLNWKILEPTKNNYRLIPHPLPSNMPPVDERSLELMTKRIIEAHRKQFGMKTCWNDQLSHILRTLLPSYEQEKITGKSNCIDKLVKDTIQDFIRPYHSLKVAPACTNIFDAGEVFRALADTSCGLEILGNIEEEAQFSLCVHCVQYQPGVMAIWGILALESQTPIHHLYS